MCLSVCCFLVLSSSSVSRASTFSLTSTCSLFRTSTPIVSRTPSTKPKAHPHNEEYCAVATYNPLTVDGVLCLLSPVNDRVFRLVNSVKSDPSLISSWRDFACQKHPFSEPWQVNSFFKILRIKSMQLQFFRINSAKVFCGRVSLVISPMHTILQQRWQCVVKMCNDAIVSRWIGRTCSCIERIGTMDASTNLWKQRGAPHSCQILDGT